MSGWNRVRMGRRHPIRRERLLELRLRATLMALRSTVFCHPCPSCETEMAVQERKAEEIGVALSEHGAYPIARVDDGS